MLTLHTTERFATWFQALEDADAEEIATEIELIGELGPAHAPPRSSELLLWYQCPSGSVPIHGRLQRRFTEFSQFSARLRSVLTTLESESVQRKLAEVSDERAVVALTTLRRIAARASFQHVFAAEEQSWSEVEDLCRRVFEALGMSEATTPTRDGLRELSINTCKPPVRVLYGVDAPRSRGLLILGESLDGCAYGPSVRRALALRREFMESARVGEREWSTR